MGNESGYTANRRLPHIACSLGTDHEDDLSSGKHCRGELFTVRHEFIQEEEQAEATQETTPRELKMGFIIRITNTVSLRWQWKKRNAVVINTVSLRLEIYVLVSPT
ncbi:hypothetical protein Bca52824_063856 [Brassica carinata]|uniref:Uncharacterized protein n=1 Tax=Brassica carinata TaxID=52824 RepID=A0A8X7UAR5_BRACI|nr:hypothetical protein Bca52824_063856 [Brassica carinata]